MMRIHASTRPLEPEETVATAMELEKMNQMQAISAAVKALSLIHISNISRHELTTTMHHLSLRPEGKFCFQNRRRMSRLGKVLRVASN